MLAASLAAAQDFAHFQIEKVGTGFGFTTGPVWSPEGYLIFSDIPSNRVLQLAPSGDAKIKARIGTLRDNAEGPAGNAYDAQGRLYTCETHARRVTRRDKKGNLQTLADRWEGKRLNSPGDIVVRRDGHAYFTDPAFGSANASRELDFCGVFHITPKGELRMVAQWHTRPNGVALSPDGRVLYVGDSDRHLVAAWDLDRAGEATNMRTVVGSVHGVPNGIRTDEKGNLYVAANGVSIFTPDGRLLGVIPVGETPSNCAFGGENFGTLFITARSGVYRTDLGVKGSVQY